MKRARTVDERISDLNQEIKKLEQIKQIKIKVKEEEEIRFEDLEAYVSEWLLEGKTDTFTLRINRKSCASCQKPNSVLWRRDGLGNEPYDEKEGRCRSCIKKQSPNAALFLYAQSTPYAVFYPCIQNSRGRFIDISEFIALTKEEQRPWIEDK